MRVSQIAAAGLALAILCVGTRLAQAGCFELVGCPDRDPFTEFDLSLIACDRLNFIRNSIFAEKGYCFDHPRYRRMFGRYECVYETAADVPLNATERDNIQKIRKMETEKSCPR
jgi:hypothetical protein